MMEVKMNDKIKCGKNLKKPIREVMWRNLERSGDHIFASECFVCDIGVFLVRRDKEKFYLEEEDNCIHCGQRIKYLDIEAMRRIDGIKKEK